MVKLLYINNVAFKKWSFVMIISEMDDLNNNLAI